jgi:hypothetical protein
MIRAVLLVLLVLVVGDRLLARQEMGNLLDHVEVSESAMKDFIAARTTLVADFRSQSPPANTDAANANRARITSMCGKGDAQVAEAGVAIEDGSVLPWHTGIARARDRYVAHSKAWQDYLSGCASDPLKLADDAGLAKIRSTFAVAHTAFDAAIPWPSSSEQEARTTAIFAS